MRTILVVEDAPEHQIQIESCIDRSNKVLFCNSYHESSDLIQSTPFDLVILDINLPDGEGFDLCTEIRTSKLNASVPVIFVTARKGISDKVLGFTAGADDYLLKPFDPRELKVRIDAKLRSSQAQVAREIRMERLRIDMGRHRAYLLEGEKSIELALTHQELRLLIYLVEHVDRVLSRAELLRNAWRETSGVTERTIDRHVSTLRSKLRGTGLVIEPIYGTGYLLRRQP